MASGATLRCTSAKRLPSSLIQGVLTTRMLRVSVSIRRKASTLSDYQRDTTMNRPLPATERSS